MIKRHLSALAVTLLIFAADQWSKFLVLDWFKDHSGKVVLTSFLNIVLAWNKGISYGLFQASNPYGIWALIAVALMISFILIWWIITAENYFSALCFALILGGALGNVMDRFQFGAVVDFIDFHIFGYHWYTFNIADCGIVIGAALLLIQQLFSKQHSSTQKSND